MKGTANKNNVVTLIINAIKAILHGKETFNLEYAACLSK